MGRRGRALLLLLSASLLASAGAWAEPSEARQPRAPAFRKATPEQRRAMERQWEGRRQGRWEQERRRFREATPDERSRMRERFEDRLRGGVPKGERYRELPASERERIRDNAAHFRSLTDEDRERLRGALRHLRGLSPDERRRTVERLLEE